MWIWFKTIIRDTRRETGAYCSSAVIQGSHEKTAINETIERAYECNKRLMSLAIVIKKINKFEN